MNKADADAEAIITSSQTKDEIYNNTEKTSKCKTLFQGLGSTKTEPIRIETDRTVKQIQQKQ